MDEIGEVGQELERVARSGVSRRTFLARAAILGVGASSAASILAACSSDEGSSSDTSDTTAGSDAPDDSGDGTTTTAADTTPEPAGGPKIGGVFREGYDRDLTGPDPVRNAWADPTFNGFYEALVMRSPEGPIVPMLASAFSNDDTGWRFTLRDGLKFHSGADCTPEIVVENFELFRDPDTGQNGPFWEPITAVTNDGPEITCATDGPFQAFQETITTEYCYILNPAAREEAGDQFGVSVIDGTGPFKMTEFTPNQKARGERWDDYPGTVVPFFENKGTAYLDAVEWIPITEASQRAPEIESGNVDAVKNPPPQDVDRLLANDDLVVLEFQEFSNFFLSLNVGDSTLGFDDVRVRQAVSHAINREGIVDALFRGRAAPTYGPVMPGWKFYNPDVENFNQFDLDESARLFAEAGWTRDGDGILEKDGTPMSFTTLQLSDTTENTVMQAVSEMVREAGVEMKVEALEGAAFFPELTNELTSYAFKWLWSSPIDVVALFVKFYQPESPELDAVNVAFAEWQTASDEASLEAAALKVQSIFAEQVPLIPLYTPNTIWVHHKDVIGWTPNQANLYPFYNDVWMDT